ncbi:MAG: magnesium transporter [Armatimonadetes bacterium]|nr:magnesium transporter [Armatimonadota bacterium]
MTLTAPAPELDTRAWLEAEGPAGLAARLLALHPVEIVEVLEPLDPEERLEVVVALPNAVAAPLLILADAELRQQILDHLDPARLAAILDHLPLDDQVEILDQLDTETQEAVLAHISAVDANQMAILRTYPPQSVGRLMIRSFPRVRAEMTVRATLEYLRRARLDVKALSNLYVVTEDGRLEGVLSLAEVATADPSQIVHDLMQTRVVMVTPDTDREVAANLISRYDFLALPVVDEEQHLLGIVTIDDLVDVLIQEGTEDVLRLGGVAGHAGGVDETSYWAGRITAVVRKRFSWLLLLFVAETFTGTVLRHFGQELHKVTQLAFFVPLLIGTGGNAGSQTVTTIVRGLALREIRPRDALRVLAREASTGILLGLMIAVVAFGRAVLWGAIPGLPVAVGLAIVAITVWATTVGTLIPLVAQRLRIDPTVVSAPFITTFVDATGLVIYFLIAKAILGI